MLGSCHIIIQVTVLALIFLTTIACDSGLPTPTPAPGVGSAATAASPTSVLGTTAQPSPIIRTSIVAMQTPTTTVEPEGAPTPAISSRHTEEETASIEEPAASTILPNPTQQPTPASSPSPAPTPTPAYPPTPTPTPTPAPTPTPEPTPTPTPTSPPPPRVPSGEWRVHESSVHKFAIRYEESWSLTDGGSAQGSPFLNIRVKDFNSGESIGGFFDRLRQDLLSKGPSYAAFEPGLTEGGNGKWPELHPLRVPVAAGFQRLRVLRGGARLPVPVLPCKGSWVCHLGWRLQRPVGPIRGSENGHPRQLHRSRL